MKTTIQRLYATAAIIVLGFFDRGVDGVVASLTATSLKLDRLIAQSEAAADSATRAASASFDRVREVKAAEEVFRDRAYAREDAAISTMQRAKRVRERVAALLD